MAKERRDSKKRILNRGEYQKSDGRYMYRYTDAVGETRFIYSWTLTNSDRTPKGKTPGPCLRDLEKKIAKDIQDGIDTHTADKATLNDYFEMYLDRKAKLKPTTRRNYRNNYEVYIRNRIGSRAISNIRYSDIKKCYCNILDEHGISVQSLKYINAVVSPVFGLAVKDNLIRTNPASGVISEIKNERECTVQKRHALTVDQQNAFMDFVDSSKIYRKWKLMFVILLGTGCRIGELAALTWDDCDFSENVIHINRSYAYYADERTGEYKSSLLPPKTKSGIRTIPMFRGVREALLKERVRQMRDGFCTTEIDGVSGFIIFGRSGKLIPPARVSDTMHRLEQAYNKKEVILASKENRTPVLLPSLTPHVLRHTFCTRLCESGMNIKVIQEVMGHANISVTMDIYNSATTEFKKASFEGVDGMIRVC